MYVEPLLSARHFEMSQIGEGEYNPKEASYSFLDFDPLAFMYMMMTVVVMINPSISHIPPT